MAIALDRDALALAPYAYLSRTFFSTHPAPRNAAAEMIVATAETPNA